MGTSQLNIRGIIKDYIIPIVIPVVAALIPFSSDIYNSFTEPDFHFIYQSTYKKNPVLEWNRQINKVVSQLGTSSMGTDAGSQDLLLRNIGKEIHTALPAMASEIGFKPMDSETVHVVNISRYNLRNIRAHFKGCIGFDSYQTFPDTFGSAENRNLLSARNTDTVTIRYANLYPQRELSYNTYYYSDAKLTYYGSDTSQCKPIVEAEIDEGRAEIGKEYNLEYHLRDLNATRYRAYKIKDYAYNILISITIIYGYFQIRSLKKRINLLGSMHSQQ